MPIQTYKIYTGNAYKGQESDASTPRVNGSGVASVDTGFGLALKVTDFSTTPPTLGLGHTAGNVFGISIRELNHEAVHRPSDGTTVYKPTETLSIMREGYINIEVTERAVVGGVLLNVVDATGEFAGGAAGAGETASLNIRAMESGLVGAVIRARVDIV